MVTLELAVRMLIPVRNVGPAFSEYDPIYGKRLKASFTCTRITPEFRMTLTTNSQGFRGPEPAGLRQRAVWFLGDSFTEGYGVSDGEEYPAVIRQKLKNHFGATAPDVLNAGVGDTGNGRWRKFLERESDAHPPVGVVLQMTGNDFFDNTFEARYRIERHGALVENPVPPPGNTRRVQRLVDAFPVLSYSYLVSSLRQVSWFSAKGAARPFEESDPNDVLTYRIVGETLAECARRSLPVTMLLVGLNAEREGRIRALAPRIPVLTVPPRAARPDLYYKVDMHWTPAGHRWVADQLWPELLRQLQKEPAVPRQFPR
jgi:hypothetical protein